MNGISFLYLLVSVLVLAWLHFHVPGFDEWKPETFGQFVLYMFVALTWFFGLMVSGDFFEILDSLRSQRPRRRTR